MTSAQIKSEANGIWLCPGCARKVDDFAICYPAQALLEMKSVRERSQQLALLDPTIAFVGNSIGIKRLDRIVRDHLPDMSAENIAHDAKLLYAKWVKFEAQYQPPARSAPLPESAITLAIEKIRTESILHPSLSDYHWQELITSWEEKFVSSIHPKASTFRSARGVAQITARHPVTGEIAAESIKVRALAMHSTGKSPGALNDGSIFLRYTYTPTNALNWNLAVRPFHGTYEVQSELTVFKDINLSKAKGLRKRADFEAYANVLTLLGNGWEPVGFVGLDISDDADLNLVHPLPVKITNLINPDTMKQLISTVERAKLGYELEKTLGVEFEFTSHFFNLKLTPDKLREQATLLLKSHNPNTPPKRVQSPGMIKISPTSELVLVASGKNLRVELSHNVTALA
ncbi:hypothetical protein [Pseudomonas qingdaonensis]|uniref:hypothetical protein n=1 Tax=Pseudomonas qingdaonensis TaxID=2056231 RepID=UPI0024311D2C|nr:hypothetical protein [Pseudomonas qingdaonensis]